MKLRELDPHFVRREIRSCDGSDCSVVAPHPMEHEYHVYVDTIAEAQGVWFDCPKCFQDNGGSNIGVHAVLCWFSDRGIPDDVAPGPGRWVPVGTSLDDLTLNSHTSRSVALTPPGCSAHFYITGGEATWA